MTYDQEVYLKSSKEKVTIKAVIKNGKKTTYRLYNGMVVSKDELLTELPTKRGRKKEVKDVIQDENND